MATDEVSIPDSLAAEYEQYHGKVTLDMAIMQNLRWMQGMIGKLNAPCQAVLKLLHMSQQLSVEADGMETRKR